MIWAQNVYVECRQPITFLERNMHWYDLQYNFWDTQKTCLGKPFSMSNMDRSTFMQNLNSGNIAGATTNCCVHLQCGRGWYGRMNWRPAIEMTVFNSSAVLYGEVNALASSYAIREHMLLAAFGRQNQMFTNRDISHTLEKLVAGDDTPYFACKSHDPDFNQAISVYIFVNRNMSRREVTKWNKFFTQKSEGSGYLGGVRLRLKSVLFLDNLIETMGWYQGSSTLRNTTEIVVQNQKYYDMLQGLFELQHVLGQAWRASRLEPQIVRLFDEDNETPINDHCVNEKDGDEQSIEPHHFSIDVPFNQAPDKAVETMRDYFSEQASNHPDTNGKAIAQDMLSILNAHLLSIKKDTQPLESTLSGVEI